MSNDSFHKPILVEPVEQLGGGNTRDAAGTQRYMGFSTAEALDAACNEDSLYAWEWLKLWWMGDLEEDDQGPKEPA